MPCEVETRITKTSPQPDTVLDLPEGVPPLTSLYLYIAGACNLACLHCWISPIFQTDNNGGEYLKLGYIEKAVREAKPLGLSSVKLTGGEPTLHPQFREIVSLLSEEGLKIIIETNGTLVNHALADFLKQKQVSFISVSLDGAIAETHEALRRVTGSFHGAIDGINALVDVGYRPQLICSLHKGNINEITDVVSLGEKLGCGSVKFNIVQRIGRGEQFSNTQGFSTLEIINLHKSIENYHIPRNKIRIYFDIPIAFHPIRRLFNSYRERCSIKNILGILAGGELSLCGIGVTTPELIFGNIENDRLQEIWYNNHNLVALRDQIPNQMEGICSRCIHQEICLGHCIANNFITQKKLNGAHQFCSDADMLGIFPETRKK